MQIEKRKRKYFAQDFDFSTWQEIGLEFEKLKNEEISSAEELLEFWKKVSELIEIIEDKIGWLYINMTRFADDPERKKAFMEMISTVGAEAQKAHFALKKKFVENNVIDDLGTEYDLLKKIIKNDVGLYREENVALMVKEQELSAKYGEIMSQATVQIDGQEKTLQQLAPYFEEKDRSVREKVWRMMYERLEKEEKNLNQLFDELKEIRVQIAKNAGYENYRDYMHQAKGRFSYSPEDLLKFHSAIEKVIMPFIKKQNEERRKLLSVETLRPWDMQVETGKKLPKPFETVDEFIDKGIRTLSKVDAEFGKELQDMSDSNFLDLESRKGKAPGGYNYPIFEYGSSYIFMSALGTKREVETLVHEAGHAMHRLMTKNIELLEYQGMPSEVAELASMSMETMSISAWDLFYPKNFLKEIERQKLIEDIKFLPWGIIVDKFQHWIYTNPMHSVGEREEYFSSLLDDFGSGGDWSGLEKQKCIRWLLQIHFFEYPFYYIEYVFAQLGALAIYRNYIENPSETIENYKKFLSLGYTKSLPEIYAAAGIRFDFSEHYLQEIVDFVETRMGELA